MSLLLVAKQAKGSFIREDTSLFSRMFFQGGLLVSFISVKFIIGLNNQ